MPCRVPKLHPRPLTCWFVNQVVLFMLPLELQELTLAIVEDSPARNPE
jgi:hypothetical protein